MKINDWIKCWNYGVSVVSLVLLLPVIAVFGVFWKFHAIESATHCLLYILAFGSPFIGTIYTAVKMIGLLKSGEVSAKFNKLMKIRQWSFFVPDLCAIIYLIMYIENGHVPYLIRREMIGVYVVF